MNITVFGATGKVGRLVVAEAIGRGHTVTVFVRQPGYFRSTTTLRVIEGDIYQPDKVAQAIVGSEGVISALGSWGSVKKDILITGMRHIIPAMENAGLRRIVTLTGADARIHGYQLGPIHLVMHLLLRITAAAVLRDGENHIRILQQSNLNWTVIRSPVMNNWRGAKNYRLGLNRPLPWATVSRMAVACALVDCVEATTYKNQAPYVSRS